MVANVGSFLEIVFEFESYLIVYCVDLKFFSGEEIWMRLLKMRSFFFLYIYMYIIFDLDLFGC